MKPSKICFLLALGLTVSAESFPADQGGVLLNKTSAAFERDAIKAGLTKIGIGEGYQIIVADERDLVENTAAQEMQQFLAKVSLSVAIVPESEATGGKRIILGRESNLKAIRDLGDKGELSIRNVSAADDGFHLKQIGHNIVIAGANPRGVLYGVYEFEDFLKEGRRGMPDIRRIPRVASRFELLPTFLTTDHPQPYREFSQETAAYFARLCVNGCIDGGGGSWELSRFVSSDIFPFQKPPDSELQRRVAITSSLLKRYGIGYYIMLWEPTLARVGADIAKYPPDALGTIKRPWGGDKNGMDRTLCVTSPVVQEHYRNMVKKFVRQYPDVEGFLFYNLDGDSWLCTPQLCPRCQLVCTDSPPDTFHPWETQALFTDLLARAAREERSDFEFIHWVSHFEGHAAERLVRTSREYSALAYGVRVGDHDVMIADTVVPSGSEFLMLQKVCAEKSVPFFVTFSSNTHEVIPNGFPFPFHIAAALKKLHTWNVRAISGCGPIPYFNQIDALVEKEFLWNPEQNPETFLVDLSVRQFGKEAGKLMYEAWEEIKTGMDVWKDTINHPFLGSHTPTSLGFSYFTYAKAILPEIANEYEKGSLFLGGSANASDSAERFHSMGVHLAKAAALAKQAVEKAAANEPIGVAYFEGDATPTMKEYAELNYAPIAIADVYCRLRYNIFASLVLLKGMERDTTDRNSMAARGKEVLYHDLIREDIAVRKRFVELLKKFSRMRPCLTRTSLSEEGIAHQIAYMNSEIGKMENYLVVVDTTEEFK